MIEEEIGSALIGAAIRVHSVLGRGLLEGAYESCLVYELEKLRFRVRRQVSIPIRYEGLSIDNGIVVELKAIEQVLPVHRAQLLSYLRLGGFKLGCLLNFNVVLMRHGINRLANGL